MPPDVVYITFLECYLMISGKFFINNFALKCTPGFALVGVLPLERPPDVREGLEILQITNKFC